MFVTNQGGCKIVFSGLIFFSLALYCQFKGKFAVLYLRIVYTHKRAFITNSKGFTTQIIEYFQMQLKR